MLSNKKHLILGLLVICILYVAYNIYSHFRQAKTDSIIAAIDYVVGKSLSKEDVKVGFDPVKKVSKEYPSFEVRDGSLVDAWGNKISITITETKDSFKVTVTSPGRNKKIDSIDDQQTISRIHKKGKENNLEENK